MVEKLGHQQVDSPKKLPLSYQKIYQAVAVHTQMEEQQF